jgi:small subunit ribosomal protein S1
VRYGDAPDRIKQCKPNPWEDFSESFNKGDRVSGTIKSITDFGIFIGLEGGIDGLIHLSDLSWNEPGETAVHNYKKGDEIDAVVLAVDPERERISLGVKQIDRDPFGQFVADNPKGSIVKGIVKEVDVKHAVIDLGDGVEGVLRASEISRERVEDVRQHFKEGQEVESKFIGTDRKSRMLSLSIKAKDYAEEAEAMSDYTSQGDADAAPTTLGDLMKEQLSGLEKDKEE